MQQPKQKGKKRTTLTNQFEQVAENDDSSIQKKVKKKQNTQKLIKSIENQREENKKQKDKDKLLPHRWISFQNVFDQKCFGQLYQPLQFSFGNKQHSCTCILKKAQVVKQNKYKDGKKFPGADKIIMFLHFDSKLYAHKNYTVCYEDRFLGLCESDLTLFVESGEVPQHRIQFFKCNGEIVWDRKNKFCSV